MAGFGLQPAGTSNGGFGTPPTAPTLTGKTLQDPTTGAQQGGRYIDSAVRDYRLNEDNRLAGMNNVQQMVYLAIRTDKASSALRDLGNRLKDVKVITGTHEKEILTILTEAVQHIVDAGLISVLGFSKFLIGPDGVINAGASYGRFRFMDLTTKQEASVPV